MESTSPVEEENPSSPHQEEIIEKPVSLEDRLGQIQNDIRGIQNGITDLCQEHILDTKMR
jgi:hypothetical protein